MLWQDAGRGTRGCGAARAQGWGRGLWWGGQSDGDDGDGRGMWTAGGKAGVPLLPLPHSAAPGAGYCIDVIAWVGVWGGASRTWASRTRKHSEAGYGRPVDRGAWTAKTVERPPQQPAQPPVRQLLGAADAQTAHPANPAQPPHPAQPRHTNYWAPRTRKRHQREHRPQRPTERSDPTQHAKGRPGDCPGPRKPTATGRNVTQGEGGGGEGAVGGRDEESRPTNYPQASSYKGSLRSGDGATARP